MAFVRDVQELRGRRGNWEGSVQGDEKLGCHRGKSRTDAGKSERTQEPPELCKLHP